MLNHKPVWTTYSILYCITSIKQYKDSVRVKEEVGFYREDVGEKEKQNKKSVDIFRGSLAPVECTQMTQTASFAILLYFIHMPG